MGARASWVRRTLKGKMCAFGCFPFFGGELDSPFLNQYILIIIFVQKQGNHRFGRLLVPLVCTIWDNMNTSNPLKLHCSDTKFPLYLFIGCSSSETNAAFSNL
jgi:hypothetical protein